MESLYLEEWNTFIRYRELSGSGPTLVYLPGLCLPALEQFLPVLTYPDMVGHHSLLIDYLGSGFSDYSQEFDYSIENHARTVAIVLDHLGYKNCTIIGHSMGGTVAIQLRILRPDLVSKLIVAEANLSPGGGETSRRIAAFAETEYVGLVHQRLIAEIRKAEKEGDMSAAFISAAWSRADPAALYRTSAALVALDPTFKEQYLKMSIPRTFIFGGESLPKSPDHAQPDVPDPATLTPYNVQIAVVPQSGHMMMFDNLSGFVNVLKTAVHSVNWGKR